MVYLVQFQLTCAPVMLSSRNNLHLVVLLRERRFHQEFPAALSVFLPHSCLVSVSRIGTGTCTFQLNIQDSNSDVCLRNNIVDQ